MTQIGVILYHEVADRGQLDCSKWVRQVKHPCCWPGWDGCLIRDKKSKVQKYRWYYWIFDYIFNIKPKKIITSGHGDFVFTYMLEVTLWQNSWCSQPGDYWIVSIIKFQLNFKMQQEANANWYNEDNVLYNIGLFTVSQFKPWQHFLFSNILST